MKLSKRHLAFSAIFLATLGIVFLGPVPGGNSITGVISRPVAHVNQASNNLEPKVTSTEIHIQALRSRAEFGTSGDAFFVEEKASPVLAAVAETKADLAPPNPFSYLGKQKSNGEWQVFLARGDETFVVHADSNIDDSYHVSSISPPNMKLLYAPSRTEVDMNIGDGE